MTELCTNNGTRESPRRFIRGRLRVWLLLALVLLSAIMAAGSQSQSRPAYLAQQVAPARAKVVLDTTRHDYGEVFAGEELDYPYNILNAGTAPLELMQRALSSRAANSAALQAASAFQRARPRYILVRTAARPAAPS